MADIKWLNSQIKNSKNKLNGLNYQKELLQQEIDKIEKAILDLENKLEQLQKEPQLSEHAIIRYLERVLGFDLESLKKQILTPEVIDQINTLKNGKIIRNEFIYCFKNKTIITVLKEEKR